MVLLIHGYILNYKIQKKSISALGIEQYSKPLGIAIPQDPELVWTIIKLSSKSDAVIGFPIKYP